MPVAIPLSWLGQLELFLLLLARTFGLFVVAPVFGGTGVPVLARIGLAAFVAGLLVSPVGEIVGPPSAPSVFTGPWGYLLLAGELFVGGALGFIVLLLLSAVQVAGQLMDIPLGFGMVNVLDPQTGAHVPVLGQFQSALAMLIFFTVNGHHGMLRGLAASYQVLPPGGPALSGPMVEGIVTTFANGFVLGVRLAIPLVAAAFLTDVALAIVSRAVPQINVFITGFPLKVMVGMSVLVLVLPGYVALLGFIFGDGGTMMQALWSVLGVR